MASIPKPATLAITAGDTMNYGGQNYVITSVAAGVDDGLGNISYAVTLTGGRIITVSAKNCVQELQNASATGADLWVQNATY